MFPDISASTNQSWYEGKNVSGLSSYQITDESTPVDYALFALTNLWMFMVTVVKLLTAIFWVWPLLTGIIGIPAYLATILQFGLWLMYVLAFIQVRANLNPDNYK
jgi:cation transporter-like permease